MSEFKQWKDNPYAKECLIFLENIEKRLSINETALTKEELYTIITNKRAKGKKGATVTIFSGTKVIQIIKTTPSPKPLRNRVKKINLGMVNSMKVITKKCFPKAVQVTDYFHVQKLPLDALQDIRKIQLECFSKSSNDSAKEIKAFRLEVSKMENSFSLD